MPLVLFLLILPIVELWVLIEVGSEIGALPTIGLLFLAAILGLTLLRKHGASVLMRANQRMQMGEVPAKEMVDGMFLAVGGILLLIPGFVTDVVALVCLVPGLRDWLIGKSLRNVVFRAGSFPGGMSGRGRHSGQPSDGDIFEGEFKRQDPPTDDQKRLP